MESMVKALDSLGLHKMLAALASIFLFGVLNPAAGQAASPTRDLDAGIKLLNERKIDQAIKVLKEVTAANQSDPEGWYYLGVAYVQCNDFKKASKSLETAISLKTDFSEALTAFSYALLRRGLLAQARIEAERALRIQAVNPDAHYTLGIIEFRSGSRDKAAAHASQAIKQRPEFAEAYLLKGQVLGFFTDPIFQGREENRERRRAQYQEAAEALEKYVLLAPKAENNELWKEQAETLRYFIAHTSDDIRTGREVSTKAKLLSKPEPIYTNEARQSLITGTVVLRVVFASDGLVKHLLVVHGLLGGLTEQALRAAKRIKFVPATVDGKAVSMWMQLEYNFNLY